VTLDSNKFLKKSICGDRILRKVIEGWEFKAKSKGSLGRRGDFSASEPSSGEKPVK
jgi:hypothetical protein